jgi:hypothetical protein
MSFFVKFPHEKSLGKLWQNEYPTATTATRSVAMSKKPMAEEVVFRPDPNRTHQPIDQTVKLPRQVRLAAQRAEDLIAGRQPRPVEVNAAIAESGSASKFSYTDAQIDAVLERWDHCSLNASEPDFGIIIKLAREGAQVIKARRRGAQKKSEAVTRRLEALFQAYWELPSDLQQHPTGRETVERLCESVSKKVGLPGLSEDTVRQDIRQIPLLLRLVKEKIVPPPGQPRKTPELEERTRLEQEAGRRAVARAKVNPDLRTALIDPLTGFEK